MEASGVIVRFRGDNHFIPLESTLLIVAEPPMSCVPGTTLGIALVGDRVSVVLPLGPSTGQLLLCEVNGEPISLSGVEVVATGSFPIEGNGLLYSDAVVPRFDVGEQLSRFASASDAATETSENLE